MPTADLTIELHLEGAWHEAAVLTILDTDAGPRSPTHFAYLDDHIVGHATDLGTHDERAVSERFPLQFEVWTQQTWPAFAFDIAPMGAARRWWRRRLGAERLTEAQLDFQLFRDRVIEPIGHMRVAPPEAEVAAPVAFAKEEVCRRDVGFLEHAADMGAAIGGATGAGGDAPKILLAEDEDGQVYPAGGLADDRTMACWLVKWPRGRDTDRDRLVLHTEYLYAHALAELGLDTRPGEWRQIEDGRPSLWLPRFDRVVTESGLERVAVESFYSLSGITQPGAAVSHQAFLSALARAVTDRGESPNLAGLVGEYLCRDLLDVVLGNSDNHGRNRAVIRSGELRLAPIYDLAPMIMDPEGATRSSHWGVHERGGRIDWLAVCRELDVYAEPGQMESELRQFADRLLALPDLLCDAGLREDVVAFPRIYLGRMVATFEAWGLR